MTKPDKDSNWLRMTEEGMKMVRDGELPSGYRDQGVTVYDPSGSQIDLPEKPPHHVLVAERRKRIKDSGVW